MSKLLHAVTLLVAIVLYRTVASAPMPGGYTGNSSTNSQIYLTTTMTGLD